MADNDLHFLEFINVVDVPFHGSVYVTGKAGEGITIQWKGPGVNEFDVQGIIFGFTFNFSIGTGEPDFFRG